MNIYKFIKIPSETKNKNLQNESPLPCTYVFYRFGFHGTLATLVANSCIWSYCESTERFLYKNSEGNNLTNLDDIQTFIGNLSFKIFFINITLFIIYNFYNQDYYAHENYALKFHGFI